MSFWNRRSFSPALSLFVLLFFHVWPEQTFAAPVVPGGFGWGMETRAAYGCGTDPTMYRVTSLADSGPGTLREALQASEPRVIIFDVSGYIDLKSNVYVMHPCMTVAGQTAPSPGITVRAAGGFENEVMLLVSTHDSLWQHFRIRMGSTTCNSGLQFWNFDDAGRDVSNNVLDHMSISWSQDEGIAFVGQARHSTMWRSIVAETLVAAPGSENCGGGGLTQGNGVGVGGGSEISILQNLLAHNRSRNPQIGGNGSGALENNLIFGAGLGPWWAVQPGDGAFTWRATGNYLRRDGTSSEQFIAFAVRAAVPGSRLYLNDNSLDNSGIWPDFTPFAVIADEGIDPRVDTPPIEVPGYTATASSDVFISVLANAGARPLDRDAVDSGIVQEVHDRRGSFVISVDADGGYPHLEANWRSLEVPSDPHAVVTGKNYTNLELWLQGLAAELEP